MHFGLSNNFFFMIELVYYDHVAFCFFRFVSSLMHFGLSNNFFFMIELVYYDHVAFC